jgi:hypothetical protein
MSLTFLTLQNTQVTDVSPLVGMPRNHLDLRGTPVTDLTPLAGMSGDTLLLADSLIKSLTSFRNIKVANLELDRTAGRDLGPIEALPIRKVFLEGCRNVRDLLSLARCQQLEVLTIPIGARTHSSRDNEITSLIGLRITDYGS